MNGLPLSIVRRLAATNHCEVKGSLKNKLTFSGVQAPDWQGAKTKEYQDIPCFRNAVRRDAWAPEDVKLFLSEP